jgi:magnesium transporter
MGTGGNSGGQSSVAVIRGISLGEIEWRDTPRVLLKEIAIGVLAGAVLGVVTFGEFTHNR